MTSPPRNLSDGAPLSSPWSLLQHGVPVVLPCPVPFSATTCDLTPAIESYRQNELIWALRFVELRQATIQTTDPDHWPLSLIRALLQVALHLGNDAWGTLQQALAWRGERERKRSITVPAITVPAITVAENLVMATIALAVHQRETAEQNASKAVAMIQTSPTALGAEVLQDVRADAMTVFAALRLAQRRYHEADTLLALAHDIHVQAGDVEQRVGDLILMAEVEFHSGCLLSAHSLLYDCEQLLAESFDPTRHLRRAELKCAVSHRLRHWKFSPARMISRLHWN